MKRTISEEQVALAGGGELSGPAMPEAARRPLRELMDDRLLDALLGVDARRAGRGGAGTALESELTAHLGYEKGGRGAAGNARNGNIDKTVQTGVGFRSTARPERSSTPCA
jgi:hypothetical protein